MPYTHSKPDADRAVMGSASSIKRHFRNRDAMGLDVLDIPYSELVKSPEPMMEKIYHFCGLPLSDDSRQRMMDWNDANPKNKHGKHGYSLSEYGYTEEQIAQLFEGYIDFLKKLEQVECSSATGI